MYAAVRLATHSGVIPSCLFSVDFSTAAPLRVLSPLLPPTAVLPSGSMSDEGSIHWKVSSCVCWLRTFLSGSPRPRVLSLAIPFFRPFFSSSLRFPSLSNAQTCTSFGSFLTALLDILLLPTTTWMTTQIPRMP